MAWIVAFFLTIAGALVAPKVSIRFLALFQLLYTIEWSFWQLAPPTVPRLFGLPLPPAVGIPLVLCFVVASAVGAITLATGRVSARYFILPVFAYFLLASFSNLSRPLGGSGYFGFGPGNENILTALLLFAFFEATVLYRVARFRGLDRSS